MSWALYVGSWLLAAFLIVALINETGAAGPGFKARYCADPARAGGFTCRE